MYSVNMYFQENEIEETRLDQTISNQDEELVELLQRIDSKDKTISDLENKLKSLEEKYALLETQTECHKKVRVI